VTTEAPEAPTLPSDEPVAAGTDARRGWPFGFVQTIVLVALCVLFAGLIGWQLGGRGDGESFNDTDAGFLEDMIAHHSGAVSMSFAYLRNEHDPTVGHFAREIVTTQSGEMAMMNALVADAGNPEIATDGVAMEWMGAPMDPAEMPGMASEADFEALRAAEGLAADDIFTRLMIEHHEAGVAMATRAARDGENPRVRRLARNMAELQRTEIAEMNRRRVELGLAAVPGSAVAEGSSSASGDGPHSH
jgi:uncharacterized protein (DUF305 family)